MFKKLDSRLKTFILNNYIKLTLICVCFLSLSRCGFFEPGHYVCSSPWGNTKFLTSGTSQSLACQFELNRSDTPTLIKIVHTKKLESDLNQKTLNLKFLVTGVKSLSGLEIRFLNQDKLLANYNLPLFTEEKFNLIQEGIPSRLSLPLSSLELKQDKDLAIDQVQLFINTKPLSEMTFTLTELEWVKKPSQGLVSITFDDGYLGNFQAAEIMKQSHLSGTAYLIPVAIDKPDYLTTEQIAKMKVWGWDISSHYETPITDLTSDQRPGILKSVISSMTKLGDASMASHFAYPLGQYDNTSLADIKKLYKSSRLAGGGFESLPASDLYRIRSINVTPALSAEQLLEKAELAIKNGDWAVFMFHYLDQPDKGELNYSSNEFKKFIKSLESKKNQVKTISKALN